MGGKEITKKRRNYFEKISTEEFTHFAIAVGSSTYGLVISITAEDVEAALRKMIGERVVGPNDLAGEPWEARYWDPTR